MWTSTWAPLAGSYGVAASAGARSDHPVDR